MDSFDNTLSKGVVHRSTFPRSQSKIQTTFPAIYRMSWSPDGKMLALPTSTGDILIWDLDTNKEHDVVLHKNNCSVFSVAWSPDSSRIVSGSGNGDFTARVWDVASNQIITSISAHERSISGVEWTPTGGYIVTGDMSGTVIISNAENGTTLRELSSSREYVSINNLCRSPDNKSIAAATDSNMAILWDTHSWESRQLIGHRGRVYGIAWCPDGSTIATASADGTIRIWEKNTTRMLTVLEGHTDMIYSVSYSADGKLLASKSADSTVRLWRCDNWETVAVIPERTERSHWAYSLSFHPSLPLLATMGDGGTSVRLWDIDLDSLLASAPAIESVHYTTAKLTLVGESGVGKTGLGWKLAHGVFKEHASTHGQQFWVIDELGHTREDGTQCEAVLWDLAGQPDYRLVHSLFLDDVDMALILFDPTKRDDPLSGVEYWLRELSRGRNEPRQSILVGARLDRGHSTLTKGELDDYCVRKNIQGGYIGTSAREGIGLDELMERINSLIPWEEMTSTVTTETFKRIKEFILSLKEDPQQSTVLVSQSGLRTLLLKEDTHLAFTDAEMMTSVRHLETHGYVTILRTWAGDTSILLFPDLLVKLASSYVLEARRNIEGLGVLEEEMLLKGIYGFKELDGLDDAEKKTLLDAATVLFLEHNVCFRETFNETIFLVFPSLINEKRPRIVDYETVDDASYKVSGAVENIYASLVVLLGYTNTFTRTHQWQNQAQYELTRNEICGFRLVAEREGELELLIYYGAKTQDSTRLLFKGLFERFLDRRDIIVEKYDPVVCSQCGEQQERTVVIKHLEKGRMHLYCSDCGERVSLPKIDTPTEISVADAQTVNEEHLVAKRRTAFEAAIVRVKSLLPELLQGRRTPSCFISYAWGNIKHEKWVLDFAKDLRNVGINVVLDRWHNAPGTSISKFIELIEKSEFVLPIGTPEYRAKYDDEETDSVVDAEVRLINSLLLRKKRERERVIPILLSGSAEDSFPPLLRDSVYVSFKSEIRHFVSLFDLILSIFDLPFDHHALEDLRESMI